MDKITLRPSSLATFVSCPFQWYNVFILKNKTIPNARAAIGNGIHSGVETMWKEAIKTQNKNANKSTMEDSAIESYNSFVTRAEGQMIYDDGEDDNTAHLTIRKGISAYIEDILPYTKIPKYVEYSLKVSVDNPMIESVSGTVDYLGERTLADIKTSKRKIIPSSHTLQQSTYKLLAERNGHTVDKVLIQGVVLAKTKTVGGIDKLEPNVSQVEFIIRNLLDRVTALYKGTDPHLLFPGNPKHYLCSDKYCNLRPTCPYVNGVN